MGLDDIGVLHDPLDDFCCIFLSKSFWNNIGLKRKLVVLSFFSFFIFDIVGFYICTEKTIMAAKLVLQLGNINVGIPSM